MTDDRVISKNGDLMHHTKMKLMLACVLSLFMQRGANCFSLLFSKRPTTRSLQLTTHQGSYSLERPLHSNHNFPPHLSRITRNSQSSSHFK